MGCNHDAQNVYSVSETWLPSALRLGASQVFFKTSELTGKGN